MSSDYTLILRACPEGHRESAAVFIGKLFSLKEHTCQQIVSSCPIVLLTGLGREEAAAVRLMTNGLQLVGATVEIAAHGAADLPKIDWPRRPQVFKRELSEWVADLQMNLVHGGQNLRLLDLLLATVDHGSKEFKGANLPEVTPFGVQALPPPPAADKPASTRTPQGGVSTSSSSVLPPPPPPGGDDTLSRLNELFPDEEGGGFMPAKDDITNILNKILPDEQPAGGGAGGGEQADGMSGARKLSAPSGGFSVFLAKIADEDRRKKAAPLIAELGKISPEEAEALSKKMIIPVLRGASKEEAEAAKAQFGKIGILARIKEG